MINPIGYTVPARTFDIPSHDMFFFIFIIFKILDYNMK